MGFIEDYKFGIVAIAAIFVVIVALSLAFPAQNLVTDSNGNAVKDVAGKGSFRKAPELVGIEGYINTDSNFSIASLRGKVVIVDFWTYTCINCIRTLPYLKTWNEKYADKGLVIIGVQTPEFDFEKDYANVKNAVEKYGIKYPVVLDNGRETWSAYDNHFWPHKYLVDADGYIRYDHIGEGGYEETEQVIQKLLAETGSSAGTSNGDMPKETTDFLRIATPELYLGYAYAREPLGNPEGFQPALTIDYNLQQNLTPNLVYLEGTWQNRTDSMRLVSDRGKVALVFNAKNANIVAGNMEKNGSQLRVFLNGKEADSSNKGADAIALLGGGFVVPVSGQRLYNIVSMPDYGQNILVFEVEGKGFDLYTFTFG